VRENGALKAALVLLARDLDTRAWRLQHDRPVLPSLAAAAPTPCSRMVHGPEPSHELRRGGAVGRGFHQRIQTVMDGWSTEWSTGDPSMVHGLVHARSAAFMARIRSRVGDLI
jgi:hypothetical protein